MTKDELIKALQDSHMAGDDPVFFVEGEGLVHRIVDADDGQNAILLLGKDF
jgi:cupin superfamily acireductone dioxygenase involved in methionine salvage